MKFGVIINDLDTFGPATANFEQCVLLSLSNLNKDHEICIFTFGDTRNHPLTKNYNFIFVNVNDFGFKIKHIGFRNFIKRWQLFLFRILKMHDKLAKAHVYYNTSPLNKALKKYNTELVWQPYCMHPTDVPYILNSFDVNYRINSFLPEERLTAVEWQAYNIDKINIMQRASYVITSTISGKNELINYFNIIEDKIKHIPFFTPKIAEVNFADTRLSKLDVGKLPKKFLFYPSRIVPHKNHITILLALKELKEKYNFTMDFVFVGQDKGNLAYIKQKITEFNLTDNVHYYGSVSFQDLAVLYQKAFALVYASINGPDNLPPLEAFANNCPVIASHLSGTEEQLGDCALLFEKLDFKQLAAQILKLDKDEELRKLLIVKGRAKAADLTPDKYVLDVLKIVDEYKEIAKLWDGANFAHKW